MGTPKPSSLTVTDFQGHAAKVVPLAAAVTVLVGPSDAGKSSLVRAIRWACLGGPATGYGRHGGGKPKVTLRLAGVKVSRTPGTVTLGKAVFRAVGQKVPDEVADALAVGPENFQSQLDPPFWFTDGAGEVSRSLNRMVNLDLIDTALALAANKSATARKLAEVTAAQADAARDRVQSLAWVPAMLADWDALEVLRITSEQTAQKSRLLDDLLAPASRLKSAADRLGDAKADGSAVVVLAERLQELTQSRQELESLLATVRACRVVAPDLSAVDSAWARSAETFRLRAELEGLLAEAATVKETLCRLTLDLAEAADDLATCPTCPACGSPSLSRSLTYTSPRSGR